MYRNAEIQKFQLEKNGIFVLCYYVHGYNVSTFLYENYHSMANDLVNFM